MPKVRNNLTDALVDFLDGIREGQDKYDIAEKLKVALADYVEDEVPQPEDVDHQIHEYLNENKYVQENDLPDMDDYVETKELGRAVKEEGFVPNDELDDAMSELNVVREGQVEDLLDEVKKGILLEIGGLAQRLEDLEQLKVGGWRGFVRRLKWLFIGRA
jgi:hypothetical protein